MRPTNLLASLALCTAITSAWPSGWDPLGTKGAARIRARQDNNEDSTTTFDLSFSGEQGNTATTEETSEQSDESTASSGDDSSNTSDSDATTTGRNNSDNEDATTTDDRQGTRTSDGDDSETSTSTRTFDNRLPAGGVQMVTPDPIAGAKYYKIKDYVTFGFNFTSLSITPSAIDILATCSLNSATYTIAQNHSVTRGADAVQAVTWDTGEYQSTASVPLLLGTYTLMIHDAAKDIDATPMAGYLGTWEQFTFGMYIPQPYTPLADYVCATCNGAWGQAERQAVGFLAAMVGCAVLGAGWFVGVAGIW